MSPRPVRAQHAPSRALATLRAYLSRRRDSGQPRTWIGLTVVAALVLGLLVPLGLLSSSTAPASAATVCGPATSSDCNEGIPAASQLPYCFVSEVDQTFELTQYARPSGGSPWLFEGTYSYPGGGSGTWELAVDGPVATTNNAPYHEGPAWGSSPAGGFFVVLNGRTVDATLTTTPIASPATVEQTAVVANIEATTPEWPYQNQFVSAYRNYTFSWPGTGQATVVDPQNQTTLENGSRWDSGFTLRQRRTIKNPSLAWRVVSPANVRSLSLSATGGSAFEGFKFTGVARYVSCVQMTKVGSFVDDNNDGYASPGETIEYTYVVSNPGGSPLTDVVLDEPGVTFSNNNLSIPAGGSVTVTGQYSITLADIVAGRVVGNGTVTATDPLDNALSDTSDDPTVATNVDPNNDGEPDDPTTVLLPEAPPIDFAIAKVDAVDPVRVGDTVEYTVTVTNNGSGTLRPEETIRVVDTIPSGLSSPTFTASAGTYTSSTGAWTGLSLAPNESATLTVRATASVSDRTVNNTATVTGPSHRTDPTPGNNTANQTTRILPRADLVVTKTDLADPVAAGSTVTWTVTVLNQGPDAANSVQISDDIPAGLSSIDVSPASDCSVSGSTVTCAFGTVAAGASRSATITARIPEGFEGSAITNEATATTTSDDPTPGNNTDSEETRITKSADLVVVKSSSPSPYVPGDDITYTISVRNNGPSTAQNATITDDLSGLGLSNIQITSPASGCTLTGEVVTCSYASLAVDATETITLTATVDSGRSGALTNRATADSATADPNTSNNTGTNTNSADPKSDLVITKVDSADPVVAGQPLTYTLNVTNAGPSDAREVVVSDTLPDNVTVASGPTIVTNNTAATGTCATTCTFPTLQAGETVRIQYTVDVPADTPPGEDVITNTARVESGTDDPSTGNNEVTETTDVVAVADLAVTKRATTPYVPGEELTYTLTVTNAGPSAISGTTATDVLPPGVTFVSSSPDCTGPAGGSSEVSCTVGALGNGQSQEFTITVATPPGGTDDIVNNATVDPAPGTTDPRPGNNSTGTTTSADPNADLAVTKTASSDALAAGEPVRWTIVVSSEGPSTAADAWLTDQLPDIAIDASVTSTAGSCNIGGAGLLGCAFGDLPPGEVVTVTVSATVDPNTPSGTTLNNTATVGSDTPDAHEEDNRDSATSTVSSVADVSLVKTASPLPYAPGAPVSFTFHVTNNGPSTAVGVAFDDPELPASLSNATFAIDEGDGTCAITGSSFSCADITLEPFSTFRVTLTADTDADVLTGISNTATLREPTAYSDPNSANNTSTIDVPAAPQAQLGISKTPSSELVRAGTELTWTLSVTQGGPSTAVDTTVTDTLPAGVTFVSATVRSPYTGTCSETDGSVSCDLGDVAVGAVVVIDVVTAVPSSATPDTVLSNSASVDSALDDPDTSDNTATAEATVTREADLVLTKSDVNDPVVAGGTATWTVIAENIGPSDASAVRIVDTMPAGFTLTGLESDTGSCVVADATCEIATLPSGDRATITVTADVAADYLLSDRANPATNSVTGTLTESDPHTDNNTDTEETLVEANANVSIQKTGPETAGAGETIEWTLETRNAGPSFAEDVVIADDFPAGVSIDSITFEPDTIEAADVCSSTTPLRCTLGNLPPDTTITTTIRGTVDADYLADGRPATLSNAAEVSTNSPGDSTDDNTSEADTTITETASVSVTKTPGTESVVAGEEASWTITVRNGGPAVARDVRLTDTLPDGFVAASIVADPAAPCDVGGTCTLGDLAVDASVTITVRGTVDPAFTGDEIVNQVAVQSATEDDDPSDNGASSVIAVTQDADLTLTKTGPESAVPGSPVTYTLTVANAGPSDAFDVRLTEVLPADLTEVELTPSQGSCDGNTCTLGTILTGENATLTVTAVVDPASTGETLTNTASVTSSTPDSNPDDNNASTTSPLTPRADVSIIKSEVTDPVTAGESLTWNLTVSNEGPSVARNVVVTDPLPLGVALESVPASCASGPEVRCELGDLAPGATLVLPITVAIDADYYEQGLESPLRNTAIVQTDTVDPETGNNSDSESTTVAATAGIALTKEGSAPRVIAGETITWVLTAVNNGSSTSHDVIVNDPAPEGTRILSVDAENGAPCEIDNGISCDLGVMNPGTIVRITVVAEVDASYIIDGRDNPLHNVATAISDTPEDTLDDNTATDDVLVIERADLTVTKDAPEEVDAGEEITWSITVSNDGPSWARNVTLEDAVPTGIVGVTASPSVGTCTGTVQCDLGNLAPEASVTVTITGTIPSDWLTDNETALLPNTVEVDSDTPDPQRGNNSSTSETTVTESASLSASKTAAPSTFIAGETATWTISVRNDGPSDAREVVIADELVDGVTVVSATTNRGTSCALDVSCTISTIPAGETAVVTIVGELDANWFTSGKAPTLTNTASVTSRTTGNDVVTASTTTPVDDAADLVVTKDDAEEMVSAGETVSWNITVTNRGPSDAPQTRIVDTLPAGLLLDTISAPGCDVQTTPAPGQLTCDLGTLAVAETATVTVSALTTSEYLRDEENPLRNTAEVSSAATDRTPDDNIAVDTTQIVSTAGVSIAKSADVPRMAAGEQITWTLQVRNAGPSLAQDVRVVDAVPSGVTIDAISSVNTNVDCSSVTAANDTGEISCTLGDVPTGDEVFITVTATVTERWVVDGLGDDDGYLVNTATVSTSSTDPDPGDNTATAITPVVARADLQATKTADPEGTATAGSPISWTITVSNDGPSVAQAVAVSDPAPDGVEISSATATPVAPFDGAIDCDVATGTVTCTLAELPSGAAFEVLITGTVSPSYLADHDEVSLVNIATVTSDTPDPTPTTPSSTVQVDAQADLTLNKVGPTEAVLAGETITWTLTATNNGPSEAQRVVIEDPLPTGVRVTEITPTGGGQCTTDVTCRWEALDPDQTVTVRIVATVDAAFVADGGTELTNTATIRSQTPDPDPAPPAQSITPVAAQVDLSLDKSDTIDPVVAGTTIQWTLTVRNAGPSVATNVTVTDPIPDGVQVTSAVADDGSPCTTDVSCTIASLAPGQSRTITVTGTADANWYEDGRDSPLENTAQVTADEEDADPDNNSDSETTTITATAGLAIGKNVTPSRLVPGEAVTWTLTVRNAGPSTAVDAVIEDQLPDHVTLDSVEAPDGVDCDDTVRCALGSLPKDATVTVVINATVNADAAVAGADEIVNTATVTSDTVDPTTQDNTATTTSPVVGSADVSLVKTVGAAATAGGELVWTLSVHNAGPSQAQDVVVSDPLPEGLTFVSASSDRGDNCSNAVVCELGTVDVDETVTITIVTKAPVQGDTTMIDNTATVSSRTDDPDQSNNVAGASGTALGARIEVVKALAGEPKPTGDGSYSVSYRFTVSNTGDSPLNAVNVNDNLANVFAEADSFRVTELTSDRFSINPDYTGTGDTALLSGTDELLPGQSGTISLTVAVAVTGQQSFDNTATATGSPLAGLIVSDQSSPGVGLPDSATPVTIGSLSATGGAAPVWVSVTATGVIALSMLLLMLLAYRRRQTIEG